MFFVLNKEKIYSYIVVLSTVFVLFAVSTLLFQDTDNKTIETAANIEKELPIYSVDTKDNKVAITMNCAWNADDIDQILKTLDKQKVKITFFMVGEWVDKYPDAVKKISQAGHEIANHSDNHKHVNNLSYEENVEEILNCSKKIKEITGKETTLYRGPYGEYNNTVIKAAKDNNHTVIQWSLDTLDYNGLDEDQMWDRLKNKITNGSIILMHNGTENTAKALDGILTKIKEKGFEIVKVSDLIYKENYQIDNNGTQKQINTMNN